MKAALHSRRQGNSDLLRKKAISLMTKYCERSNVYIHRYSSLKQQRGFVARWVYSAVSWTTLSVMLNATWHRIYLVDSTFILEEYVLNWVCSCTDCRNPLVVCCVGGNLSLGEMESTVYQRK